MALLVILVSVNFTTCSDDDDDPPPTNPTGTLVNPADVFPNGMPKSVGGMVITTNAQGLVTQIVDGDKTATFTYPESVTSRAMQTYDVKLLVKNNHGDEYDHGYTTYYINLNEKGFMTCATEEDGDKTWFDYNADWQVNQVRYEEKEDLAQNETAKVTYASGNIVALDYYDTNGKPIEGEGNHFRFEYGPKPIVNKGAIMLFDHCFAFDINELQYVYYAGMMGKATKNLPIKQTEADGIGWSFTFEWTLNPQGFPIQLCSYEGEIQDPIVKDFRW